MQRRKDQLPQGVLTKYSATLCSRKTKPPSANARIAVHSTEGVRLTVLVGHTSNLHPINLRDTQWDVGPHYEDHQSAGVGTPVPPYFLGYPDVELPLFQLGHPGPYGYLHGLPTLQPSPYYSYTIPGGYNGFVLGAGGTTNPSFTAGYDNISARGGAAPGSEDPGSFSRCDTNPGGPIHLTTTNISVASAQVSPGGSSLFSLKSTLVLT